MQLSLDQESQFVESNQAPAFLEERTGLKIAGPTLATHRCRGGGPIYSKFGKRVYYPKAVLIAWAVEKLGRSAATFSEHKAREVAERLAEEPATSVRRGCLTIDHKGEERVPAASRNTPLIEQPGLSDP